MFKSISCSILAGVISTGWLAAPLQAADAPTPYPSSDSEWPGKGVIRKFDWFKVNRDYFWTMREKKQGAVVVAGDSLVGNWKNLEKAFPNLKVANRGIGGDVSRSLLFRFQEDVLDLNPKAVVILVGTNDLSAHGDPADTLSNIAAMVAMTKAKNASTPVILCTTPPRNSPKAPMQPGKQEELNSGIKNLAQTNGSVKILDLYTLLGNPDGTPVPEYFQADLLHLAAPGYAKFQEALAKLFTELNVQ